MIKYLRIFCLCCLVLFAGLGFYGKNKFHGIKYLDIENNFKYTTMSNQDFLKLYPDTAKKMINDQQVASMAQLVDQSDYILKVKNTSKKSIAGNGIINECEVLRTYKGKVKQKINIYDMTYVIDQTSVGYIEGSKPLIPLREYIVFLKKSKKVNVKNTYMFSSVHFGAFDVDDRNESINNYDNNSLTLKQTYSYDYIGCDDQFVEKYQFLKKQLDNIDK